VCRSLPPPKEDSPLERTRRPRTAISCMPTLHTPEAYFQGTPTELVAIYNELYGLTDYQVGGGGGLSESPSCPIEVGSNRNSGSTCSDCCLPRGSSHSGESSSTRDCSAISSGGAVAFIGLQKLRPAKLKWGRRRRIKLHRHFRAKAASRNNERHAATPGESASQKGDNTPTLSHQGPSAPLKGVSQHKTQQTQFFRICTSEEEEEQEISQPEGGLPECSSTADPSILQRVRTSGKGRGYKIPAKERQGKTNATCLSKGLGTITRTKPQLPKGSTDEEKERAVFKTALGEYYDRYYHNPEFKELVSCMTRLEFVEGHILNCGISDLRSFFGVCKGTQSALLGRAYRADGVS
jgi:hypothetical protein